MQSDQSLEKYLHSGDLASTIIELEKRYSREPSIGEDLIFHDGVGVSSST